MTRPTFTPTYADELTGRKLRDIRKTRGDRLRDVIDGSGLRLDPSTLSRVENGKRRLTDAEAAKIAAYFGTSVDRFLVRDADKVAPALLPAPLPTVDNMPRVTAPPFVPDALTARPGAISGSSIVPVPFVQPLAPTELARKATSTLTIDLDNPMHPDDYRLTVWLPYLEARYNEDERKSA